MKAWIVSLTTLATIATIVVACTPQGTCERTRPDGTPNVYEYCDPLPDPPKSCKVDTDCSGGARCFSEPGSRDLQCVKPCDIDKQDCGHGYLCKKHYDDATQKFAEPYCFPDCHGRWLDATHWESNPIDGYWIPYPAQRTVVLHLRDPKTGRVVDGTQAYQATPYIASADNGYDGTLASGLLTETFRCTDGANQRQMCAINDTCAEYFLRVVVTIPESPADAGTE